MPVASIAQWQAWMEAAQSKGAGAAVAALAAGAAYTADGVTWEAPHALELRTQAATSAPMAQKSATDSRARWRGKTWSELSLDELLELEAADRDLFDRLYADRND